MKYTLVLAMLVLMAGSARADLVTNLAVPDSFTFLLTSSKDDKVAGLLHGFQITVSKAEDGQAARFDIALTPSGIAAGFGEGSDGVKFKDFALIGGDDYFTSTRIVWDDVWLPSMGTLSFLTDIDWDTFAANIESISMTAHIQSINTSGKNSINEGVFTYTPTSQIPEPSTLLIVGFGIAALPLIRRRFAES